MALLNPVPKGTISQRFEGTSTYEPPLWHQNYRGLPLAAYKSNFPGSDGYSPHYHGAIDYAAPLGTPIIASEQCKIVQFGTDRVSGALYVYADIRPGTRLEHWHLSKFPYGMAVGKVYSRGSIIGYVGSTGWSTGNHDHFVLKITERDPDGVTRQYLYNPQRFMVGGDLANDSRVKPIASAPVYQYIQINSGASVNIRTAPNLLASSIYATSSPTGIYRNGTRIAAADVKMRLDGWATGAGYVWAKAYFNGGWRYIAKPWIHIV